MRLHPFFSFAVFLGGAALLGYGAFLMFSDSPDRTADLKAVPTFDRTPPPDATPSPTADPSATAVPASPTPIPYDGNIGRLELARLGISNAIESIGLVPGTNQLDTPHDAINKIGWYYIYAKPGFGGNAVFSAHVNYNFKPGPFAHLMDVQRDDEIVIQMDGGPEYRYRVFRKQRYDVETIPMGDLIRPKDRPWGEEWITLITCGGRFVATQENGLGEYKDRDVVVAMRVQ